MTIVILPEYIAKLVGQVSTTRPPRLVALVGREHTVIADVPTGAVTDGPRAVPVAYVTGHVRCP